MAGAGFGLLGVAALPAGPEAIVGTEAFTGPEAIAGLAAIAAGSSNRSSPARPFSPRPSPASSASRSARSPRVLGATGGAWVSGTRSGRSSSKRLRGGSPLSPAGDGLGTGTTEGFFSSIGSRENHSSCSLLELALEAIPGTRTLEWHFGQSIREPTIDAGALSLALHCGQLMRIGGSEDWLKASRSRIDVDQGITWPKDLQGS